MDADWVKYLNRQIRRRGIRLDLTAGELLFDGSGKFVGIFDYNEEGKPILTLVDPELLKDNSGKNK
jgi:hypothetical protein